MPESPETRRLRRRFNRFPAYRATVGKVTYVAADFTEVRIGLRLSWLTRNLMGTIFGGSLYSAADPIYAVMLMHLLGPGYVVWDKAATIAFRRPARSTLAATFRLDHAEIDAIRAAVREHGRTDRVYRVDLVDDAGRVHVEIEKTIHIAPRDAA